MSVDSRNYASGILTRLVTVIVRVVVAGAFGESSREEQNDATVACG